MNQVFDGFVKELCSTNMNLNEPIFFAKSAFFLEQALTSYLHSEGQQKYSLRFLILSARKRANQETDRKFWDALLTFNKLVETAVESTSTSQENSHWLRFINIIEHLQGYKGSLLFTTKNIKKTRKLRLYFAYMLTYEHLRYIAGDDDGYSPSSEILEAFSALSEDDQHDHQHDHQHNHH